MDFQQEFASRRQSQTRSYAWSKVQDDLVGLFSRVIKPQRGTMFPACVYLSLSLALILLYLFRSFTSEWGHNEYSNPSMDVPALQNYFSNFGGFAECNIRAAELYITPSQDQLGFSSQDTFCRDRKHLMKALSEGGRVGFDAPYVPRNCYYRWFHVQEICFILERFDGLVFIGDDTLQTVYSGLNILLRRDLALGALNLMSMDPSIQEECRCGNQFVKQDCRQHHLTDSERLSQAGHGSTYFCDRTRHAFLRTEAAQPDMLTVEKFRQLVPKAPRSKYRPIPIIYSIGPATLSSADAASSLLKFLELADDSGRNTPMLWVGPVAAGHIELKGRKGNQEIWDFDRQMASIASENEVEVLGMWNMTVQATSWDGMRYGEKIAITQAMMIMNWLSRLESS